jgi:hypothetical protein
VKRTTTRPTPPHEPQTGRAWRLSSDPHARREAGASAPREKSLGPEANQTRVPPTPSQPAHGPAAASTSRATPTDKGLVFPRFGGHLM